MRILWQSPALWYPTGYSIQSKRIIPELQKMGHEIIVVAFDGLQGGEIEYMGVRHLPPGRQPGLWDITPNHFFREKCDLLVTVQDNWIMNAKVFSQMPWMPWFPVDDDPVSPLLVRSLQDKYGKPYTLKNTTYSKWGVNQLKDAGIPSIYLPESVPIDVYTDQGKSKCKKILGFGEDEFVVGMVAANFGYPSRKAFEKNLIGFAKFANNHPNARLYMHTNFDESWRHQDSYSLLDLIEMLAVKYPILTKKLGKVPRISFPDQYLLLKGISDSSMAKVYSSFDVLLAASMSEGFGLPILEAQACSRPVIATNFSSMPEMTSAGWLVDVKDMFLLGRVSYQAMPDEDSIAECLEKAYQSDLDEMGRKGRKFAEDFDNPVIAKKYWKPILDSI